MGIREQTLDYMADRRITRGEMAQRIGFPVSVFCKWLDGATMAVIPAR